MGESKRKAKTEAKRLQDCGDFVEALDGLIKLRLRQNGVSDLYAGRDEDGELVKRDMKDWLRRNSAAHGLYVE